MAPPKFADLGKDASDLITKNFHFGVVKLELTTTSANGVKITTGGTHNTDTGNATGSLEAKVTLKEYGITMTEKRNTNNVVSCAVGVDNKMLKGVKADVETTLAPVTGKWGAKVKLGYADCDYLNATADLDCKFPGLLLHGSGVFAYKGWHAGYQASYDVTNSKLTANNVSVTYRKGDLALHSGIIDASKYVGSVHHQVNKKLSAAALLHWTAGSSNSSLTVCGKYQLDGGAYLKAKLDNDLRLGLAYVQRLRPGVQLTLSGLVNAKSLEQGGHKLGMSLNFDA